MARKRRLRRKFTDEYRAEVVRLVETSDKSIPQIAQELDLIVGVRSTADSSSPDLGDSGRHCGNERGRVSIPFFQLRREVDAIYGSRR